MAWLWRHLLLLICIDTCGLQKLDRHTCYQHRLCTISSSKACY